VLQELQGAQIGLDLLFQFS